VDWWIEREVKRGSEKGEVKRDFRFTISNLRFTIEG